MAREGWPDEETERINGQSLTMRTRSRPRRSMAWALTAANASCADSAFACVWPSLTDYWLSDEKQHTLTQTADHEWRSPAR